VHDLGAQMHEQGGAGWRAGNHNITLHT
jgi:hypothetical protein